MRGNVCLEKHIGDIKLEHLRDSRMNDGMAPEYSYMKMESLMNCIKLISIYLQMKNQEM